MNLSTLQLAVRSLSNSAVLSNAKFMILPCLESRNVRNFHITSNVSKEFRIGITKIRTRATKHELMEGEESVNIGLGDTKLFPDASTKYEIYNDVPYNQLHIINVKTTTNNTIMSFTDYKGKTIMINSAGMEGFKHSKKGSNVGAQQAAVSLGLRIRKYGIQTVRLRIQGIGPGRMGAVKGFQLAELDVVSITDDTRVSWNPPRPRKQRRV